MTPGCSVVGCDRPHKARGWCNMHYRRVMRGNPVGPAAPKYHANRRTRLCRTCQTVTWIKAFGICDTCYAYRNRHFRNGNGSEVRCGVCDDPLWAHIEECPKVCMYADDDCRCRGVIVTGMCMAHYDRNRSHGDPHYRRKMDRHLGDLLDLLDLDGGWWTRADLSERFDLTKYRTMVVLRAGVDRGVLTYRLRESDHGGGFSYREYRAV